MNPIDPRRTPFPPMPADTKQCIEGPDSLPIKLAAMEHLLRQSTRKRMHSSLDHDLK